MQTDTVNNWLEIVLPRLCKMDDTQHIKMRVIGLYLYHAIEYSKQVSESNRITPDEELLRAIEEQAGVSLEELDWFRMEIWNQYCCQRLDLFNRRLGGVIETMLTNRPFQIVHWIMKNPEIILTAYQPEVQPRKENYDLSEYGEG
jgi:hypothetical protein